MSYKCYSLSYQVKQRTILYFNKKTEVLENKMADRHFSRFAP